MTQQSVPVTAPGFVPRRRSVLGDLGAGVALAAAPGSLNSTAAAVKTQSPGDGSAASVTYRDKQFLIDGEPAVVLAGEIHYFRLKRADWQSRLDKAKEAGLNAVATYIPWMGHETADGSIDVTGRTRPERDLGARTLGGEAVVAVDGRARCEGAKSSDEGGRTILRVRRGEFTVREG
ncbi:beta-galactosidase [Streptomyces sp. NPDC056656]|uniref:beta-galactosidase n=1 Tax=Streptomyces sp. NPDC056656 TaxID=3345895 RepID=UPI003679782C